MYPYSKFGSIDYLCKLSHGNQNQTIAKSAGPDDLLIFHMDFADYRTHLR